MFDKIHRANMADGATPTTYLDSTDICLVTKTDSTGGIHIAVSTKSVVGHEKVNLVAAGVTAAQVWQQFLIKYNGMFDEKTQATFDVTCAQFDFPSNDIKAFAMLITPKNSGEAIVTAVQRHKCTCSKYTIFNFGCKCGGI
jgi:hypothetical protein